jgi:hypothetical protein
MPIGRRGVLALMVLAVAGIGRAAAEDARAPGGGCAAPARGVAALPMPLDLAGRPHAGAGLAQPGVVVRPGSAADGCGRVMSRSRAALVESEPSEALHALPEVGLSDVGRVDIGRPDMGR